MKKLLFFLIIAGIVGGAGLLWARGAAYRDQALAFVNAAALADSARLVEIEALGDSVTAYQLLSVQQAVKADSLDEELRLRPVVRVVAGIRVDTVRLVDTVRFSTVQDDTVEVYSFGGRDGPFTFLGDARLFPNQTQVFTVNVSSDPVRVGVRIHCGNGRAVRTASVLLTAEDPFILEPTGAEQEVGVCPRTFSLMPEASVKGIGWELLKGGIWYLIFRATDSDSDPYDHREY